MGLIKRMDYAIIFQIISARIAGTGIHLDISGSSTIGYKKTQIWGIKSFIKEFIRTIFDLIMSKLPQNPNEFQTSMLIKACERVLEKFNLSEDGFHSNLNQYKNSASGWNSMDMEQKTGFYLNSLFTAIEDQRAEIDGAIFEKFEKPPNFRLEDFGFTFRAYEYCKLANRYLFNNGFSNLEKRIYEKLIEEYDSYFGKEENEKSKESIESERNLAFNSSVTNRKLPNASEKELGEVMKTLESARRDLDGKEKEKEILDAIEYIQEENVVEAVDSLELLLSHPSDKVQEHALNAVMQLKELAL